MTKPTVTYQVRLRKPTATQHIRAERTKQKEKQDKASNKKIATLDRYAITFTYVQGGDSSKQSAIGYKDMRKVRTDMWRSTRKYKGRRYRVRTVNTTKGKEVK